MGSKSPANNSMGCLFDSPEELARRIISDARDQPIIVWADEMGNLFSLSEAVLAGVPIDTAIGTYDVDTPCSAIERDLILARRNHNAWNSDGDENYGQGTWPTRVPIRKRHHAYS